MSLPTFDDPRLAAACVERQCGARALLCSKPCGECLRDIGVEPGDEFDEAAAIGRLV